MAHQNRNSNSGSRVRFNPNTGRPLGRGESTTFQGRTYREGSSNIGGTGGSSGGSNTQDPNTPRYTRETGLLTDYGRSLGLSEVSRSTRESETITSADTTPEKLIQIPQRPIVQDQSSLVASLFQTTPKEVAPSTDTQEPTNFAQIREMIGFSPQKGNVGDDREFKRAQRGVERARETSRGYTDSINAIVAKSQADQLSVTGQGRGIPEAIIGGQQAQISREAAIQALPIAAQQAAAQGNLEQAQSHLENVYRIKSESLQNEYEYQTKKYDSIMGYITKLEEAQIARLKATDTNKFNEDEDFQKLQDSLAKDNPAMATRIWGAKDRAELGKVVGGIGGGVGGGVTPVGEISPYQQEKQTRILDSVADLERRVSFQTVGLFGTLYKFAPGGVQRDFANDLNTLKANIAFGELTAMREASKTGGALGQVSDIELKLLESSLAGLSQAQSPANFRKNLKRVKDSIARWNSFRNGDDYTLTSPTGEQIIITD